jgi:O-succinylbenzoate synthase
VTITGIEGWALDLPMHRPFVTSTSRLTRRRLAVIRLRSGTVTGWGEAAPIPGHSREDFASVWQTLKDGAGAGIGAAAAGFAAATTGAAGAALRAAAADVAARRHNRPLWADLGGDRDPPVSAAVGVDDHGRPDRAELAAAIDAGYRHVKLKVTPETTLDELGRVVAAHPEVSFSGDANGGANPELLAGIDDLNLEFIEQPLPAADLVAHAELRRRIRTPVALDESADSEVAIASVLAGAAADIVVLKVGRFGPLATVRIAGQVAAAGFRCRLGGMVESGIGKAHSVAVASLPLFDGAADLTASRHFFPRDLVRPEWRIEAGRVRRPSGPGIGVVVDEPLLDQLAFDRFATD